MIAIEKFQSGFDQKSREWRVSPTNIHQKTLPRMIDTPHPKTRPATPKTPQNARFANPAISGKPRKTPGFHRGSIRARNGKMSKIHRFQNMGEISLKPFHNTFGRDPEQRPAKRE
nr:hypothetical protein [uncultured Methanoregula sp.]